MSKPRLTSCFATFRMIKLSLSGSRQEVTIIRISHVLIFVQPTFTCSKLTIETLE